MQTNYKLVHDAVLEAIEDEGFTGIDIDAYIAMAFVADSWLGFYNNVASYHTSRDEKIDQTRTRRFCKRAFENIEEFEIRAADYGVDYGEFS